MKINFFKVNNYKNLKAKAVFDNINNCNNYLALIGLNGSGKSNVLEAVSKIFAGIYNGKPTNFKYEIDYNVKGKEVTIINGKVLSGGSEIKKKNIKDYLPDQIIACYSGEETRLWEDVYQEFYFNYFKEVLGRKPDAKPDMLYINKYSWNLALIALMCSEKPSVKEFLKEVLNIVVDETITIDLSFDPSRYPNYKRNNDVLSLINRINPQQKEKESISINTLKTFDIGASDNDDFVKRIFYYLYIASMPQRNKIIRANKIITDINISFNGLTVKHLSEGEKKLLLIKCIMDVLAIENSLILLDEPDAHIHISRKKEIEHYIDKNNYFTIFTTHSPNLLYNLKENNIRILSIGAEGLEVIPVEKIKAIEKLSNGAFTLMDATLVFATKKDILLVEGTYDCKYLTKAIDVLKRTKAPKYDNLNMTIMNCGGAGNVAAVIEEVIISHIRPDQLCIATFDNDESGRKGVESVKKILLLYSKPITNIKLMYHPKTTNWLPDNDFLMEDYFPTSAYKPKFVAKVTSAITFKELTSLQNPKGIIRNNYENFSDAAFDNFELLLDEIVKLQRIARESQVL